MCWVKFSTPLITFFASFSIPGFKHYVFFSPQVYLRSEKGPTRNKQEFKVDRICVKTETNIYSDLKKWLTEIKVGLYKISVFACKKWLNIDIFISFSLKSYFCEVTGKKIYND